jgi:putative nucleotidyltransferase with HDIG domain
MVALDTMAMGLRLRAGTSRTLFNIAAPSLAMWVAGTVAERYLDLPLPLPATSGRLLLAGTVVPAALLAVLGNLLVATAVALHSDRSVVRVWWEHMVSLWWTPLSCAYIGVLLASGVRRIGPVALVAALPLPALLYVALRNMFDRWTEDVAHLRHVQTWQQATLAALTATLEARDDTTSDHVRRVQIRAAAIGAAMHLDPLTLRAITKAALLHDIGKVRIPEAVLQKPGPLTPEEQAVMRMHVPIGVAILSTLPFQVPVVPIVAAHHESWDGTGYPAGLAGDAIPIGARILSVVDCYDALTSDRPYRAAMTHAEAMAIVWSRSGSMYDPLVVHTFDWVMRQERR